jgi:predicted nucleic acid-binding protein
MKIRLYLDNCAFNRPYDDQSILRNQREAEAKIYIQDGILQGNFELAWSYIMDYEISFNPFSDRKNQIIKWKNIAKIDINESERIIAFAKEIMTKNIKSKDSLHLSCAIDANCEYFITTDEKILNKTIENLIVINPIDFIRTIGA